MNYSLIKKAMVAAGHVVTAGEHWAASDAAAFRDFAHFTLGVAHDAAHGILMFPAHFEATWKKIAALAGHHETVTPVPAAAPVEPQAATEPAAAPAAVVEPVVVEPAAEPVAETAPAEQAPETPPAETSAMTMDVSGTHSEA